jgi:hypothetical protein
MSPRKTKYGEPTVSVTVRIPETLFARMKGPASDVIISALAGYLAEVPPNVVFHTASERLKAEGCLHPKNRRVNAIKGKRCLDCGAIV